MYQFSYYLLAAALLAALFFGLKRAGVSAKNLRRFVIGMALWLGYVAGLSATGFFRSLDLPPRIPIFLVIPALGFIAWFFLSRRAEPLLSGVAKWQPVALQSFRVGVELLIYGMLSRGFATAEPTFEGYNFDVLMGLSAPVAAWLVFSKNRRAQKVALAWNYVGLLALANVVGIFVTLLVKPEIWGYEQTTISPEFGTMPYLLIPAFFMPVAVFLHVFSIRQLSGRRA